MLQVLLALVVGFLSIGDEHTNPADVLAVTADITKTEDVEHFVRAAADRFGRIDILVNNAGGPPVGAFVELTDEQLWQAIGLNLMSAVRLID